MSTKRKDGPKAEYRGYVAQCDDQQLQSWTIGALPIVNRVLQRMRLEEFLEHHLPKDGGQTRIPTSRALLLLVRNLLLSREPIYGIGEWARRYAPELLGLSEEQLKHLNDDRVGRSLDRLFLALQCPLLMDLTRHVVKHFDLSLDELHNDSTTVSFHGSYDAASEEGSHQGLPTLAITWGHSKDHRPDLKQLLYILTVTEDGGVPIYFTSASGNVADDQTHRETWDLMRQLAGRADFLYVADCKLASTENLRYIAGQGGRFVTVLPRTRREDRLFRERLRQAPEDVRWEPVLDLLDDSDESAQDPIRVARQGVESSDGFRLLWFHSERKAKQDAIKRTDSIHKARQKLTELNKRLAAQKTRFREAEKVQQAVDEILSGTATERWLRVTVETRQVETYKQATRGRPGKDTQYVKQVRTHYALAFDVNAAQVEEDQSGDGVFPLITNDMKMTPREILRAYKRQPLVEKRFSQFKNHFHVAPIYLKSVTRIQSLLGVYFFALMAQTLLERELREAMRRAGLDDLPLYPENRPCAAPTTRRLLDVFEPIQRHVLTGTEESGTQFITNLSKVQRQLLKLLEFSPVNYGR